MKPLRLALMLSPLLVAANVSALEFDLTYADGTSQEARDGFVAAAARYSSLYADPITIYLNVGTQPTGGSTLGFASSTSQSLSYASVRSALVLDATTADDMTAISGLAAGPGLGITTNFFADNPNADRATPFSTQVTTLDVNTANAKALGLRPANDPTRDGLIRFNSNVTFDFDPSDGITAGSFDFIGIATHEIGHALGFVSGVDFVDGLSDTTATTSQSFDFVTPHDLFRRSGVSQDVDMTAGTTAKYFSLDDGATGNGRLLSLGVGRGDGRQASHWKDNLGIGILDPTGARGELLMLTANDRLAFDAMGYSPVPEPATLAALGLGALALLKRRKRA